MKFARLLMTFSSLSPLFILWAVRGTKLIPDTWFIPGCLALAILPTLFLGLRIQTAMKQNDRREIVVGSVDDHRTHVLVYLFAILLPFSNSPYSFILGLMSVFSCFGTGNRRFQMVCTACRRALKRVPGIDMQVS